MTRTRKALARLDIAGVNWTLRLSSKSFPDSDMLQTFEYFLQDLMLKFKLLTELYRDYIFR
jgi:hypothetical protein